MLRRLDKIGSDIYEVLIASLWSILYKKIQVVIFLFRHA